MENEGISCIWSIAMSKKGMIRTIMVEFVIREMISSVIWKYIESHDVATWNISKLIISYVT